MVGIYITAFFYLGKQLFCGRDLINTDSRHICFLLITIAFIFLLGRVGGLRSRMD